MKMLLVKQAEINNNVLTDSVTGLEAHLGSPIIVGFGVIGRGNDPAFVVTYLEFEGGDMRDTLKAS